MVQVCLVATLPLPVVFWWREVLPTLSFSLAVGNRCLQVGQLPTGNWGSIRSVPLDTCRLLCQLPILTVAHLVQTAADFSWLRIVGRKSCSVSSAVESIISVRSVFLKFGHRRYVVLEVALGSSDFSEHVPLRWTCWLYLPGARPYSVTDVSLWNLTSYW